MPVTSRPPPRPLPPPVLLQWAPAPSRPLVPLVPAAAEHLDNPKLAIALPGGCQQPMHPDSKLYRARSRLYRNEILQVNMRLKALVEIYTMHSFAQLQNHIFFKNLIEFAKICGNFQKFCEIRNFSNRFFAKKLRLQRCKRMQIL